MTLHRDEPAGGRACTASDIGSGKSNPNDARPPEEGRAFRGIRSIGPVSEASEPAGIEPGIYEHFKGARYEVLFVARHSETEEEFVVYRQLYGDHAHWVRPLAMFTEIVERDGRSVPRFARVDVDPV